MREYDPGKEFAAQVVELARSVELAVLALPDRAENYWLSQFPKEACSNMSFILGHLLLENGYGDWTYVEASSEDAFFHAWLELRDEGGVVEWVLDATAHQFKEFSEPFLYKGLSPLRVIYFNGTEQHLTSALPDIFHRPEFIKSLLDVKKVLSAQ